MRTRILGQGFVAVAVLTIWACSGSSNNGSGFNNSGSGTAGNTAGTAGSTGGGTAGNGSAGNTGFPAGGGSGGGSAGNTAGGGCNKDPGSYDIPGNNCDDDGDGTVDNPAAACDTGLAANGDATAFAKAIGICQMADATHWGLVSATFTNGHSQTGPGKNNFEQQHGILPKFGNKITAREGAMLGVISSGSATETDSDKGPQFKESKNGMQGPVGTSSGFPPKPVPNGGDAPSGYPKQKAGCTDALYTGIVNDVIDVKLQIKVPNNAKGLSFDFDFWSGEWPEYVCSDFNDSFIAYLKSAAFNNGTADNISFDTNGDAISVNNNFFAVCTAGVQTGCSGSVQATSTCSLGPSELAGTGFGDENPVGTYCDKPSTSGGATSWLTSQAPVQPGETITLEFMIWDTGDNSWDSSALIDNFAWAPSPISGPVTQPSPPK